MEVIVAHADWNSSDRFYRHSHIFPIHLMNPPLSVFERVPVNFNDSPTFRIARAKKSIGAFRSITIFWSFSLFYLSIWSAEMCNALHWSVVIPVDVLEIHYRWLYWAKIQLNENAFSINIILVHVNGAHSRFTLLMLFLLVSFVTGRVCLGARTNRQSKPEGKTWRLKLGEEKSWMDCTLLQTINFNFTPFASVIRWGFFRAFIERWHCCCFGVSWWWFFSYTLYPSNRINMCAQSVVYVLQGWYCEYRM